MSDVGYRARAWLTWPRVIVPAGGVALLVLLALGQVRESVRGEMRVERRPGGGFTVTVNDCSSAGVAGVVLEGRRAGDRFDLRVRASGDAAVLSLLEPNVIDSADRAIDIRRQDCSRWDVLVEPGVGSVNGIRLARGHVHVTCLVDSDVVTADAEFSECS